MYGGRLTRRLPLALACLTVAGSLFQVSVVSAATETKDYYWADGNNAGQLAGSCTATVPDNRPMQIPRTILVDNSMPSGTVLHSWDFNEFLPGFQLQCTGSGIANDRPGLVSGSVTLNPSPGGNPNMNMIATMEMYYTLPSYGTTFDTNVPGVGYRVFLKSDYDEEWGHTQISLSNNGSSFNRPATGVSNGLRGRVEVIAYQYITRSTDGSYKIEDKVIGYSLRGELVKKTNNISSGNINVSTQFSWRATNGGMSMRALPVDFLSGSAIRVITPSCQLRARDTQINMGKWYSIDTLTTGPAVPVPVDLRCTGQLTNAQLIFGDTGSHRFMYDYDKNLTLYTPGGDYVEGLEIEIKYNDHVFDHNPSPHVPVDDYHYVYLGDRGVPGMSGGSFTESDSQAMFTANYVQSGPIRVNGHNYTSSVTGKVNLRIDWH